MPDMSLMGGGPVTTYGGSAANSTGTRLTTTTVNTKGTWTEIVAATAYETNHITVVIAASSNHTGKYLVDIGIGAAAAEVVLIPDLHTDAVGNGKGLVAYDFWLRIPKGTRIAARQATSVTSGTMAVQVILGAPTLASPVGLGVVTAYGVVSADSGLTVIDAGATAHTEGAWTEIVAATTRPMRQLVVGFGHDNDVFSSDVFFLVDVAIGGAGSEVAILTDLPCQSDSGADDLQGRTYSTLIRLPAGIRLAARCQCSVNDATDRLLDLGVWGVS